MIDKYRRIFLHEFQIDIALYCKILLQSRDEIFEVENHRTDCSFSRIVENSHAFTRESTDE
jgi:hypothetical protein